MNAQSRAADAAGIPSLDEHVCFALYTATHRIIRAYRPLLEPLGLTYVQYLVLLVLWEDDAARSVGELGRRLYLDSGTLTPLLKRMERSGFVNRIRDTGDERRVLVHLTRAGRELQSQAAEIHSGMLRQGKISRPEARALQKRIMKLIDTLG